jgi:hypothetical protein
MRVGQTVRTLSPVTMGGEALMELGHEGIEPVGRDEILDLLAVGGDRFFGRKGGIGDGDQGDTV